MDQRVLAATAELLGEHGFSGLRIDAVAERSRVPKSTVYRRWPSLTDLAVDALVRLVDRSRLAATDDPAADLDHVLDLFQATLATSPLGASLPLIGLEMLGTPGAAAYRARMIDPLRDAAIDVVTRGNDAGLWQVADPAAAVDMVAGAVIYRTVVLHEPVTRADLDGFVALLGVQPRQ